MPIYHCVVYSFQKKKPSIYHLMHVDNWQNILSYFFIISSMRSSVFAPYLRVLISFITSIIIMID